MSDKNKVIQNITLTHPATGDKLVQVTGEKGEAVSYWTVGSALLFILEQQPVKNVETMMRSLDLHKRLKGQEKEATLTLTQNEYTDVRASAEAFTAFLQKGVMFATLYTSIREAKDSE